MNPNTEQLNCLSKIVAEEIKKICESFLGNVDLANNTLVHYHLTRKGGLVYQVTFKRNLLEGALQGWYAVYPLKNDDQVACCPHISQAKIFTPHFDTLRECEKFRNQIVDFQGANLQIQKFLASISSGVGETGDTQKTKYWIIDPLKLFI